MPNLLGYKTFKELIHNHRNNDFELYMVNEFESTYLQPLGSVKFQTVIFFDVQSGS